jgi:hypothetical protein
LVGGSPYTAQMRGGRTADWAESAGVAPHMVAPGRARRSGKRGSKIRYGHGVDAKWARPWYALTVLCVVAGIGISLYTVPPRV